MLLDPYKAKEDIQLVCYEESELFFCKLKERINEIQKYDLLSILATFPSSYRLDYVTDIEKDSIAHAPYIGMHWGTDYYKNKGHRYPALGQEDQKGIPNPLVGSFDIDSTHKRILYNPRGSIGGRDSYFPSNNRFVTTATVSDILTYLSNNGYTMCQTTYLNYTSHVQSIIKIDPMSMMRIQDTFKQETSIHDYYAFLIDGPVNLQDIQSGKLVPHRELPKVDNEKDLIEILRLDRNAQSVV